LAFESIPGVKVVSHVNDQTFIAGDFFAVYSTGEEFPSIYSWDEIKHISENNSDFVVAASDNTYRIPKSGINDDKKLLNLRGVFEGAVSSHPAITYNYQQRILPSKTLYKSGDITNAQYSAIGVYNEREINFSNVILLNTRLGKLFKMITFVTVIVVFICLHVFYGNTQKNWIYFLPVSVFGGGIAVMFVYLICAIIAKYHYSFLYRSDPAISCEITFAVCPDGFSAVESHLHTGFEYIPWEEAAYFIETNFVYIIFKNKNSVFWLPKRLFPKEIQIELSKFISSKLYQK